MNAKTTIFGLVTALALAFTPALATAGGEQPPATAEDMAGWYHEAAIVDFAYMSDYAVLPAREDVLIIDSRPARMFGPGHIPTAIALPDSSFAELAPTLLPEDKDKLLIFYCGGYACKLSHKSAFAAEALGYTNVKVYAAGYPDWLFLGGRAAIDTTYLQQLMAAPEPVGVVSSGRPACTPATRAAVRAGTPGDSPGWRRHRPPAPPPPPRAPPPGPEPCRTGERPRSRWCRAR